MKVITDAEYEKSKQVVASYESYKNSFKPPLFVKLGNTALRLRHIGNNNYTYYKDAGVWEVDFDITPQLDVVVSSKDDYNLKHADGLLLVPCAYEEWCDDNQGYASSLENIIESSENSVDNEFSDDDDLPF